MLALLAAEPEPVAVTLKMERPERHFYQVELRFPPRERTARILKMPVWIPGSYKVRDFARNVIRFEAIDPQGKPLGWNRTDKTTWAVQVPSGSGFTVSYEVFADEYSVRTSYLDSFFGFINPTDVFLYEKDHKATPYEIKVEPYEQWSAVAPLEKLEPNRYRASDWDELADSPFQFGNFRRHELMIKGLPHYWIIAGNVDMNETEMVSSLKTIAETVGDLFGSFPFKRYYIFSQFRLDGGRGGLEHRNSTMVQADGNAMRTKKGWDNFLGLIIHEYFHAWNVKSVRDQPLGPFDYQQEVYTNLLWLHEGWTRYYDTILMARAGFWDADELRKDLSRQIDNYKKKPALGTQSLAEASFNAWINFYQPGNNHRNDHLNYYNDGSVAAFGLDLLIRHKTRNEASLDSVIKAFYDEYGQKDEPINADLVLAMVERIGGRACSDYLENHVFGRTPVPLETLVDHAGLTLTYEDEEDEKKKTEKPAAPPPVPAAPAVAEGSSTPAESADAEPSELETPEPYAPNPEVSMGLETVVRDDVVIVRGVRRDGPAWQAGLTYDDEILAINQRRVRGSNLTRVLGWSRPGDEVQVLVSRADHILTLPLKLESKPKKLRLQKQENMNDLQESIYNSLFEPSK